jgi:hypothetical protein
MRAFFIFAAVVVLAALAVVLIWGRPEKPMQVDSAVSHRLPQ